MAYTHARKTRSACCSGCARGASKCGGGLGDAAVVTAGAATPATAIDPATVLRAQVNRFWGAAVPDAYRFGPDADKLPTSGPIDVNVATRAVLIVQKRAAEAYATDPTGATDLLNKANQGFADPVGWVNKNLDMVTQTVTIYGDIHGVPAATLPGQTLGIPTPWLVGLLAIGAAFLMWRK